MPHDPIEVYQILKVRIIKKIAPGLRDEKSSTATIATVALVILACFGGVWAGFYINQNYVNPPASVWGVCAPPAFIAGDGCYVRTPTTVTVNGQPTQTYVNYPAGYYLSPYGNGTKP